MSRVSGKPYFVYVLWSSSAQRFYIGISEDARSRLQRHNAGISQWTASHLPWELVWSELHSNYSEARKRELLLKKKKGGAGFYRLTGLDASRFRNQPTDS